MHVNYFMRKTLFPIYFTKSVWYLLRDDYENKVNDVYYINYDPRLSFPYYNLKKTPPEIERVPYPLQGEEVDPWVEPRKPLRLVEPNYLLKAWFRHSLDMNRLAHIYLCLSAFLPGN